MTTLREEVEAALTITMTRALKAEDLGMYVKVDPQLYKRVLESWLVMERALEWYAERQHNAGKRPHIAQEALRAARGTQCSG